jgi:hypothetical protein
MTSLTEQSAAKLVPPRPGALPPLAPAAPGAPTGYLRPYANERLNSRLTRPLPPGPFTASWNAPIDPGIKPAGLLASGASVFALGLAGYHLFVAQKPVTQGVTTGRDAELLPGNNAFFVPDRYGRIASFNLTTAAAGLVLSAAGGIGTKRTYFHRRPSGVTLVASTAESSSPHNPAPTRVMYLQVFDAAGNATASRDGLNVPLHVAMHEDFPVLARPGVLEFLDLSLNSQRRLVIDMAPHGLSLDETGRSYLLCAVNHRQQLWIVAPTGEYVASPLPEGLTVFQRPPIVGYDHRVYLLSQQRVLCYSAAGELAWQYEAPARVAGATVSADGQLLTAVGDAVVALNAKGEARPLCRMPGEEQVASPILGSAGELYALTGRRLHCFAIG